MSRPPFQYSTVHGDGLSEMCGARGLAISGRATGIAQRANRQARWRFLALLARSRSPIINANLFLGLTSRKKWRKMALFRWPRAPFFRVWSQGLSTQATDLDDFMSADFFGIHEQEKCRAPFSGKDFVDVRRRGRVRTDAANRGTRGSHKDAAQAATLPRPATSLYLDASGYAGLR
jgi:hypothetical protein